MKKTQLAFKRYEQKYLLESEAFERFRREIDRYIVPDEYFKSTVCSVYYDTKDYTLIRNSTDAPIYKAKLRLRSYNVPEEEDTVFVELKEKLLGLVYKRRVAMSVRQATDYVSGRCPAPTDDQMTREIDWFLRTNPVEAKLYLASDREAYDARENTELRITFDENLRWRETELDLMCGSHGEALTEPGFVLMEIKIPGSAPMWLARLLSELEIFPTGFSKYGTCYRDELFRPELFRAGETNTME